MAISIYLAREVESGNGIHCTTEMCGDKELTHLQLLEISRSESPLLSLMEIKNGQYIEQVEVVFFRRLVPIYDSIAPAPLYRSGDGCYYAEIEIDFLKDLIEAAIDSTIPEDYYNDLINLVKVANILKVKKFIISG